MDKLRPLIDSDEKYEKAKKQILSCFDKTSERFQNSSESRVLIRQFAFLVVQSEWKDNVRDFLLEIKARYPAGTSNEVTELSKRKKKRIAQLKRLEKRLNKEIIKLEQADVHWSDEEDSEYLKEDR